MPIDAPAASPPPATPEPTDADPADTDPLAGLYSAHEVEGGEAPINFEPEADPGDDNPFSPILRDPDAVPLDPALLDAVHVEPMLVSEEFARLPGDMARWSELYAVAHERYLKAKLHSERTRSRRALYIRRNAKAYAGVYGLKAITESTLCDLINVDKEVTTAEDTVVYAERERVRLRGIMSALSRKGDALVTIGANMRAELTLVPHIRDKPRER